MSIDFLTLTPNPWILARLYHGYKILLRSKIELDQMGLGCYQSLQTGLAAIRLRGLTLLLGNLLS